MPVFKNVSGSELELRSHSSGGKIVSAGGEVDARSQIVDETEDAYITKVSVKVSRRNEKGEFVSVDSDELRAWPKAIWEKVSKVPENKSNRSANEKEVK